MPTKVQNVGRVTGWMVNVWREGRLKKFFDDRRVGSRASLRRAKAYRAKLLRSLPPSGKVTRPWTSRSNIERVAHWVVRLKRGGKVIQRYFRDETRGGKAAALRQALAFRDKAVRRLPPPVKLHRRSSRNSTGVIGVSRLLTRTRKGRIVPRYIANWPRPGGGKAGRNFSVLKYGDSTAKRLAVEARRQGVEELLRARKRELLRELAGR